MAEQFPNKSPEALCRSLEFGRVVAARDSAEADESRYVVIGLQEHAFEGVKIVDEDTFVEPGWRPYENITEVTAERLDDERIALGVAQLYGCSDSLAFGFVSEAQVQIDEFRRK